MHLVESLVQSTPSGRAIIYCATRRHVEEVAQALKKSHPDVSYYHAGLDDELRAVIQDRFAKDQVRILVATNAFGMGIDKPDVRLVVHYDVTGSLEAYYQEAGRAGRDGRPSRCVLLFQQSDVATQEFFIQKSGEGLSQAGADIRQRQEASRELLRGMVAYAYSKQCRQLTFLNYFGDVEETTWVPADSAMSAQPHRSSLSPIRICSRVSERFWRPSHNSRDALVRPALPTSFMAVQAKPS